MPEGWLEDVDEYVADPTATKPKDWDDEEDGEWEPPMVSLQGMIGLECEKALGLLSVLDFLGNYVSRSKQSGLESISMRPFPLNVSFIMSVQHVLQDDWRGGFPYYIYPECTVHPVFACGHVCCSKYC